MDSSYLRSLRENALQGDSVFFDAQVARFLLGGGAAATRAPIDLFIDPAGGNDSNDGSELSPIATLEEFANRIPFLVNHRVSGHLRNDTYPAPARGWLFNEHAIGAGHIQLFGDEVWDPTVLTTVATGVADVGTSGLVVTVVGGGLAPDVFRNLALEMTSGAQAGQRRSITTNDATSITPMDAIGPGTAAGDTFRILDVSPLIQLPAGGDPNAAYMWALPGAGGSAAGAFNFSPLDGILPGRMVHDSFHLTTTGGSWSTIGLGAGESIFYGVTADAALGISFTVTRDATLRTGFGAARGGTTDGLPRYSPWEGWGLMHADPCRLPNVVGSNALVEGFLGYDTGINNMAVSDGGTLLQLGGQMPRQLGTLRGIYRFSPPTPLRGIYETDGSAPINTTIPSVFSGAVDLTRLAVIGVGGPFIFKGPQIRAMISGGGDVTIDNAGAAVISVIDGATLYLLGSPAGIGAGGVATDWEVDGTAFDPLIELALAGAVVTRASLGGVEGASKIIRLS